MTVRELIDILAEIDPDAQIILQKDAEGNGYSPLISVDPEAIYIPDSAYSGEVYSTLWSSEDAGVEPEE